MTTANGQTPAPFMQNAPAVISTLGTDAHQGLTSEQAAHNLNQYGPNAFTKPKPESMLSRIVKTAADPMLIMLMIAAAITLGVNITRAMAQLIEKGWARKSEDNGRFYPTPAFTRLTFRVTADLDRVQTRLDDQRRSFTGTGSEAPYGYVY